MSPNAPMTRKQLAAELGVSTRTVHRWAEADLIPSHRINGARRYFLAEVIEALKRRKA